mgnify:CR=1 FL=1
MSGGMSRLPILFEDAEALIINKPGGLPISRPRAGGRCLEDWLDDLRLGFQRPPAPVHRIDADTSGCLLLARNPRAPTPASPDAPAPVDGPTAPTLTPAALAARAAVSTQSDMTRRFGSPVSVSVLASVSMRSSAARRSLRSRKAQTRPTVRPWLHCGRVTRSSTRPDSSSTRSLACASVAWPIAASRRA